MDELEVTVNDPFQASLIQHLYSDLQDLRLAFPKARFPFFKEEWESAFSKDPENSSLLFKIQNQTVGHIALLPNGEELFMCWVVLLPEFRGKNLANKMITATEEFCRLNYSHEELHLNVYKGNLRAIKVYTRLGYEIYREEEEKFKMKKKLRN